MQKSGEWSRRNRIFRSALQTDLFIRRNVPTPPPPPAAQSSVEKRLSPRDRYNKIQSDILDDVERQRERLTQWDDVVDVRHFLALPDHTLQNMADLIGAVTIWIRAFVKSGKIIHCLDNKIDICKCRQS
jgi:hypothetical protein